MRFLVQVGLVRFIFDMIDHLHLRRALHHAKSLLWPNGQHAAELALVPRILTLVPESDSAGAPARWTTLRLLHTLNDVAVVLAGPAHAKPVAVITITHSPAARTSVFQRNELMAALHADPRLAEWHALIPRPIAAGYLNEYAYGVQTVVEGVEASSLLAQRDVRMRLQAWGAQFTTGVLRATGVPLMVDDALLNAWVDQPCMVLRRVMTDSGYMTAHRAEQATTHLMAELRARLGNQQLLTGLVHGDLMPGNILVSPDGLRVTGLVDWELTKQRGLPYLDLLFLLLSIKAAIEQRELGDVVCSLLNGQTWQREEQALLDQARADQLDNKIDQRALLLLCWLHHVAANLSKSVRYAKHWFWLLANVEPVLHQLIPAAAVSSRLPTRPRAGTP